MLKPIRSYNDKLIAHKYYQDFYALLKQYLPYVKRIFVRLYLPYTTVARSNIDYASLNLPTVADILENSLFNQTVDRSTEIKTGLVQSPYSLTGIKYLIIDDFPVYLMDASVAANQLRLSDSTVSYDNSMANILLVKYDRDDYGFNVFPGIKTFVDGVIQLYGDEVNPRRYKIVGESKYNAFGSLLDTLYQCTTSLLLDEFEPILYDVRYRYNPNYDRVFDVDTDTIAKQSIDYINQVDRELQQIRLFGYKNRILNFDVYVVRKLLDVNPVKYNVALYPYFADTIVNLASSMYSGVYLDIVNAIRDLSFDLDTLSFTTYYVYQTTNSFKNYGGNHIAFVETVLSPAQIESIGLSNICRITDYTVFNSSSSPVARYWLKFIRALYVVQTLARA